MTEQSVPDKMPAEVWVRVEAVGICAGDLKCCHGAAKFWGDADRLVWAETEELDVLGAHLGPYCWPAAVKMLESRVLPMDKIVTHQLPLERFQEGLDLVAAGDKSVKVSLIPE